MTNTLWHLPEDSLVLVLGYLSTKDMCRLDSAVCSHLHRPSFLLCLTLIELMDCFPCSDRELLWLAKRKCRVKSMTVEENCKITESIGEKCFSIGFPHLTHLQFLNSVLVSDMSLDYISKGCHGLTHLNLSNCSGISDVGLISISKGCPSLSHLDLCKCSIFSISDVGIMNIAQGCKGLTNLYVENCVRLTVQSMKKLASECNYVSHLDMSGINGVNASCLYEIAKFSNTLVFLDLNMCLRVNDEGLGYISQCHQMQYLYLTHCSEVTDDGIESIAAGCNAIVSIDLSGCEEITDKSMKSLSTGCTQLRNLNISHCYEITVVGLQHLQKGCNLLSNLDLTGCIKITEEDLQYLPLGCQQISHKYRASSTATEGFQFMFNL